MTKKDKELLLKDLCARLPYGVKVKLLCRGPEPKFDDWIEDTLNTRDVELFGKSFKNIKPYLRPMSSMTEEEKGDINNIIHEFGNKWFESGTPDNHWSATFWECSEITDYLLSHHLDFRGLIPIGLALEAPKDMYKTE